MTKRNTFFTAFIFAFLCIAFISSCKKTNENLPLEPISLVTPDSVVTIQQSQDAVPIPIVAKITTDRPIDWILCVYDIDTSINSTNYVPTYPDTLSYKNLQTLNPPVNLYTDTLGIYQVPNWVVNYSVIRFKITFQAGQASATYGQNYPVGIVSDQKEVVFNIR